MAKDAPVSYLGDGVYAIFVGSGVQLRANDFDNPTNKIYLEREVLRALNAFYAQNYNSIKEKG